MNRITLQTKLIGCLSLTSMVLVGLSLILLHEAWQKNRKAEEIIQLSQQASFVLTAVKDLTFERGRTNVVLSSGKPVTPSDRTFIEQRRRSVDENLRGGLEWLMHSDPPLAGKVEEEYRNLLKLRSEIDGALSENSTTTRTRLQGLWFEQSTGLIHEIIRALEIVGKRENVDGHFSIYQRLMIDMLVFRDKIGQSGSIMTAAISKNTPLAGTEYRRFLENLSQADYVWSQIDAVSLALGNKELNRQKSIVFRTYYEAYRPVLEETIQSALGGLVEQQKTQQLKALSVPAFDSVFLLLEQCRNAVKSDMRSQKRAASLSFARAVIQFIVGLSLVFFTILYFRNKLFQPLDHLIEALKSIRKGDPVPALEEENLRTDEIGQLAAGVKMLETSMAEERNRRKLTEFLAITDELTGLHNRHFLEQNIKSVMDRSDRYDETVSLIMFDLDHFKQVNDTWGHPVGDAVLKQTAHVARKLIRSSDLLIRFGGEEFLLLMPHTNVSGATAAAEKIRNSLAGFDHADAGRVTASFGIAEKTRYESFESWYARADEALYDAKQSGRNRVVSATGIPLPSESVSLKLLQARR